MQQFTKVIAIIYTALFITFIFSSSHSFAAKQSDKSIEITLITGDQAIINLTDQQLQSTTLANSENQFHYFAKQQQHYLIPEQAQQLVDLGTLDIELFNLTKLLKQHLDDATSEYLPVLVKYAGPAKQLTLGIDSHFYQSINTQFIRLEKAKLAQSWDNISSNLSIQTIRLDTQVSMH